MLGNGISITVFDSDNLPKTFEEMKTRIKEDYKKQNPKKDK